jgi:colicin import membrane protein
MSKGGDRAAVRRALSDTLALRGRQLAEKHDPFTVGLAISTGLHILLLLLLFLNFGGAGRPIGEQIVYSVTIEGGKTIGGISQVAKKDDSNVAPPKNVASTEKETREEKNDTDAEVVEVKEPVKKPEPKKEPPKKAEPEKKKPTEVKKTAEKPKAKEPTSADINKDYQKAMQRYLGESTESTGQGFGAAKLGGNGMGGGVLRPPEFFTYRQVLRDSVKRGWKWYNTQASLVTWVTFDIGVDGVISNVAVAESSGNREFDDSVLRAVYKASPLPPPPASVYNDFRSVRLSFDPRE